MKMIAEKKSAGARRIQADGSDGDGGTRNEVKA